MIADALAGKIDLIVTKFVSRFRFARDAADSLTPVRQLKEKGIEFILKKKMYGHWTAKMNFS